MAGSSLRETKKTTHTHARNQKNPLLQTSERSFVRGEAQCRGSALVSLQMVVSRASPHQKNDWLDPLQNANPSQRQGPPLLSPPPWRERHPRMTSGRFWFEITSCPCVVATCWLWWLKLSCLVWTPEPPDQLRRSQLGRKSRTLPSGSFITLSAWDHVHKTTAKT